MSQMLTWTIKSDGNGKYACGWGINALSFSTSVIHKALIPRDKVEIRNRHTVIQTIRLNEPILTAGHETRLFTLLFLSKALQM